MGLQKIAKKDVLVADKDGAGNSGIKDVIGNRDDRSFSNMLTTPPNPTLIGHAKANYYHVHDASRTYPRVDDDTPLAPITVTASATALTFGAWVEITNFDTKTVLSDCHYLYIGSISDVDWYIIQLGTGESGSQEFWGESDFSRDTNQNRVAPIRIQGEPIPAGTKLWARLASVDGGSHSCKVKAYTHQYPSVTGN